jgi:NitT/TauT family transport system permease protein
MALIRVRAPHDVGGAGAAARATAGAVGVEAFVVAMAVASLGALIAVGHDWASPLVKAVPIDLSYAALPKYTLFTLTRGVIAFLLSLTFTIAYGTIAARSLRAERVMIPVLDVLQSIPVLSFIPGFVIALEALFPRWNLGLEIACVLMIFTGQVWNMTFSYHASLRAIPAEQREVARLFRFSPRRLITGLELPSAMIGLVWNSMMSMAGGWFFITIIESFKIGETQYCLPGLGSYMHKATEARDHGAMAAGIVAMILMIVVVDQVAWRPVIVWAERFKNEETASAEKPSSWAYDLLHRSRLVAWLRKDRRSVAPPAPVVADVAGQAPARRRSAARALYALAATLCAVGAAWGAWRLVLLLEPVAAADWVRVAGCLGKTALRVLATVVVGLLIAVPAGIAIGRSPRLSRTLQPVIQVCASFPAPMLYGIVVPAMLVVGAPNDAIVVTLMLLGATWYILFNVAGGAGAVPQDLREAAAAFRLVGMRRFVVLYLAAVFPMLLTGVITAAGGAWNASIVAEAVEYERGRTLVVDGIGSLIARAVDAKDYATLAAATVSLAVLLVLVNRFVWKPLHRIADERFSLNR